MKTMHRADWTLLLKILAAVIATLLGAAGADAIDLDKLPSI